jgi:Flp pilus assembly protein TadB
MDFFQVLIVAVSMLGVLGFGVLAYVFLGGAKGQTSEIRDLMSANVKTFEGVDQGVAAFKKKSKANRKKSGKHTEDLSIKLFKAGYFTAGDRSWFLRFRIITFTISLITFPLIMYFLTHKTALSMVCLILGALIGFTLPMSWLERQIRFRAEDVMYFLPLVIEQVSIGVSSALDVGPCLTNIVHMADERDSHNAVTEMLAHVDKLIRSGLSLEDALVEVGDANGTTEVKHAFMFLAQCSRHGGEVSKQLQELADSVMVQRQVQVEAKITALPVKATGPLAMVFAGFFALLFAGLMVRIMGAFGG